jgi:hypothetical protein
MLLQNAILMLSRNRNIEFIITIFRRLVGIGTDGACLIIGEQMD